MYSEEIVAGGYTPCVTLGLYCTTVQLSARVTEQVCRCIVKYGSTSQDSLIVDLDLAAGCIQGLSPL